MLHMQAHFQNTRSTLQQLLPTYSYNKNKEVYPSSVTLVRLGNSSCDNNDKWMGLFFALYTSIFFTLRKAAKERVCDSMSRE